MIDCQYGDVVNSGAAVLEALDEAISRVMPQSGERATRVPRQTVVRHDDLASRVDMTYLPMLCIVTSGLKRPDDGTHGPVGRGRILVNLSTLPVVASFTPPYRSVTLTVDLARAAAVDADVPHSAAVATPRTTEPLIDTAGADLVGAFTRWVGLNDVPEDIPALSGRYEDEILYRVLRGPLGPAVRRRVSAGEDEPIRDVLSTISEDYASGSLTATRLAQQAGMSTTTFFERFRAYTGVTPHRYIKRVRLQQARGLLQAGRTAAATATAVGYVSPAHFSRDYSRLYGTSPRRHIRELATAEGDRR